MESLKHETDWHRLVNDDIISNLKINSIYFLFFNQNPDLPTQSLSFVEQYIISSIHPFPKLPRLIVPIQSHRNNSSTLHSLLNPTINSPAWKFKFYTCLFGYHVNPSTRHNSRIVFLDSFHIHVLHSNRHCIRNCHRFGCGRKLSFMPLGRFLIALQFVDGSSQ